VSPGAFFATELAPSRRRFIEAARNATKTAITAGLAASMQILGPFGPLFAFRIGQPGISLGIAEGAITITVAALMQAAIVPITGKLLDYPGLVMAFLFAVFTTIIYLSSNTRLFMLIALTAVGTITTVYVGIFRPAQIGWGSTYTFDGILVATLVMVVVDTLIWPSSPRQRLLESIAADLGRTRRRLEFVGQRYLDPFAAPPPPPHVTSTLSSHLTLLKSVEGDAKARSPRLAPLLGPVMSTERVRLEVERLALLAEEPLSDHLRQIYRERIEEVLRAVDLALAERSGEILADLPGMERPAQQVAAFLQSIVRLRDLSTELSPQRDRLAQSELANLLGFVDGLAVVASMLEPQAKHPEQGTLASAAESAIENDSGPRPFFDPAALRFSVKLGATVTLALLVGLTTQRADLQTILWSVVVAGLPSTYGAVVRKTILRLAGCVAGGLAALAAMIVVSQNFDSLPAYLAAIFAVTMLSTYVAQSDEWLGYAGIQAGITFLVCYVGLAPSSDVYAPLWRFWGIVLGVVTTGFVFLFLWPEYASDQVSGSLERLMRSTLTFGKEIAQGRITRGRIAAVERTLSATVLQVLSIADQARLEGRRGAVISTAGIEAASILVRIAYRFEIIARARISQSPVVYGEQTLHSEQILQGERILEHQAAFEQACCAALEIQLAKLGRSGSSAPPLAESCAAPIVDLAALAGDFAATETAHLSSESRIILATQLESYRRLPTLLQDLDTALSRIVSS
jgi:uncharacterized membrane protein YccC